MLDGISSRYLPIFKFLRIQDQGVAFWYHLMLEGVLQQVFLVRMRLTDRVHLQLLHSIHFSLPLSLDLYIVIILLLPPPTQPLNFPASSFSLLQEPLYRLPSPRNTFPHSTSFHGGGPSLTHIHKAW